MATIDSYIENHSKHIEKMFGIKVFVKNTSECGNCGYIAIQVGDSATSSKHICQTARDAHEYLDGLEVGLKIAKMAIQ